MGVDEEPVDVQGRHLAGEGRGMLQLGVVEKAAKSPLAVLLDQADDTRFVNKRTRPSRSRPRMRAFSSSVASLSGAAMKNCLRFSPM
jgi:hypothetical protein